jgi:hypothetical protein
MMTRKKRGKEGKRWAEMVESSFTILTSFSFGDHFESPGFNLLTRTGLLRSIHAQPRNVDVVAKQQEEIDGR